MGEMGGEHRRPYSPLISTTIEQSARFYAEARQCTGCHAEHDGGRSIVKMDHALLLQHRTWLPMLQNA